MSKRLRAEVTRSTGKTKHSIGAIIEENPAADEGLPVPAWVEISEEDGAFYLLYFNKDGVCFADTWHQTLDAAKRQAGFEFGTTSSEWKEI